MKFTRGSIGNLTRHYERYKKENGEYIKFGNQDINTEKTRLNYNLADKNNQLEFLKKRTSEVRCLNRKDVNVMCSWVVTLPGKIKSPQDQEKFFKESYNFLEEKYGKENVISSFVHLDEVTPHMHFAFIPVVYDEKRKDYKVSAKECITKYDLKRFHPEFEKYMENVFGHDIGILNEKTKEGNRSIKELKQETAIKELNFLKENIKDKQVALDSVKNDLKDTRDDLRVIKIAKADLEKINQIEASRTFLQKDKVTILDSEYQNLLKVAKWSLIDKEKALYPYKKIVFDYKKENEELKKRIDGLSEKINEKEKMKRISFKELLPEAKLKAEHKNEITEKNKRIKKLESFIINNDLADKFNNQEKSDYRSHTFER